MVVLGKKAAAGPKKAKKAQTFTIDCTKPVEDKVRVATVPNGRRRSARRTARFAAEGWFRWRGVAFTFVAAAAVSPVPAGQHQWGERDWSAGQ